MHWLCKRKGTTLQCRIHQRELEQRIRDVTADEHLAIEGNVVVIGDWVFTRDNRAQEVMV